MNSLRSASLAVLVRPPPPSPLPRTASRRCQASTPAGWTSPSGRRTISSVTSTASGRTTRRSPPTNPATEFAILRERAAGSGARHHRGRGAPSRPRRARSARRSATSTRASWTSRASNRSASRRSKGELAAIDAHHRPPDLPAAFGRAARIGVRVPFAVNVGAGPAELRAYAVLIAQSGLGMPDRDYYLRNDEKFAAIRKAYTTYIARLFALAQPARSRRRRRAHRSRSRPRSPRRSGIARAAAIATPPTTRWTWPSSRRRRPTSTGGVSSRRPAAPTTRSTMSSCGSPTT